MRIRLVLGALGALVIIGVVGSLAGFYGYARLPVSGIDEPVDFRVEPGTSLGEAARMLAETDVLAEPLWFRLYARARGDAMNVKAGAYRVEPGTSRRELLDMLVLGEVRQFRVTIIEGWTFRQMRTALAEHEAIDATLSGASPDRIMAELGHPEQDAEGRFFPDTYRFEWGTTDIELLRRAYQRMTEVLDQEWPKRDEDLPLATPYKALILASIIEKETAVPDERDRIAGVFIRRLQQGMRLRADPTVIYGIGPTFDGNLSDRHLRADQPYNTYQHGGLPPTPIALPGRESIHAALHPAEGDALYFVARGDGSHVFSATLEEHNKAVRRYQLEQ